MDCVVCHGEIHPVRLEALPWTKTCSHLCSQGRKVQLNRAAAARRRARRRDSGVGLKSGSIIPKPGYAVPNV